MLAIFRIVLVILFTFFICIFGLIYCLFSPRNPRHVATFSNWFSCMSPLFGITVKVRYPINAVLPRRCIYIANHQNNYDMITASYAVQPYTVTVGKKSLLWIPLFGLFYWLAGNLLIDRDNSIRARNTLIKIVQKIKNQNISIWMFPEGTRSRGQGLLPFKTGAFYIAINANVPIVPICVSNISNKIKLNRWFNGVVIIEILSPIETIYYSKEHVHFLTKHCQNVMAEKLNELNIEVAQIESLMK